jgi:colanic acid biosynthesis glycosyl transferase WcaI
MIGLVSDARLEQELRSASVGVVSQRSDLPEFNVPSRLMNFMMHSTPVIAAVPADSEVASIIKRSEAGWSVPMDSPAEFGEALVHALSDPAELERRASAAGTFAQRHFNSVQTTKAFENVLAAAIAAHRVPDEAPAATTPT